MVTISELEQNLVLTTELVTDLLDSFQSDLFLVGVVPCLEDIA